MNEAMKVIKERRASRKFKPDPIGVAEMQQIMEAAIHAPNARNLQTWHFTVIQDKATIDKMVEIIKENVLNSNIEFLKKSAQNPNYNTFYHAPAVILITGDANERFMKIDCGAAMQNIALAAESLGIGSCPITSSVLLFASEKGDAMRKRLEIPDGYDFMCSISLGYIEGDKPPVPPRKTDVITYLK